MKSSMTESNKFKCWVKETYPAHIEMREPPESFDSEREIYFTWDEGHTQYGPCPIEEIKDKFKRNRINYEI